MTSAEDITMIRPSLFTPIHCNTGENNKNPSDNNNNSYNSNNKHINYNNFSGNNNAPSSSPSASSIPGASFRDYEHQRISVASSKSSTFKNHCKLTI